MATTIASAAAEILARLQIDPVTGSPTEAAIEDHLRYAFREVISLCKPVVRATANVTIDYEYVGTAITADNVSRIYFVGNGPTVLIPGSEWSESEGQILLAPGAATAGDTLWYEYLPRITITPGSTTTIDTSGLLGEDWLESPAITYGEMLALLEMTRLGGTGSGPNHATTYRTREEDYKRSIAARQQDWGMWFQGRTQELAQRFQAGALPVMAHPLAARHQGGRTRNRLFGN